MTRDFEEFIYLHDDNDELIFCRIKGSFTLNEGADYARFGRVSDVEIYQVHTEHKDDITGVCSLAFLNRSEEFIQMKLHSDYLDVKHPGRG